MSLLPACVPACRTDVCQTTADDDWGIYRPHGTNESEEMVFNYGIH